MKMIAASTKLVGLIGMPLGQTFAPRLHNEAYAGLNLDWFYFPIELPVFDDLPKLLSGLRLMNFGGMAVTKPFKVEIIKHLDDVDETARMMGSCNTIHIDGDKWTGYNTDGVGAVRSLREEMAKDLAGLKYLSFGAGGAARSVCFELAKAGAAKVTLVDINDSCRQLADEINKFFPGKAESLLTEDPALRQKVSEADVLLNLSGMGMQPYLDSTPVSKDWLDPGQVCFEAIYNPLKTRFLKEAEEKGCKIINGLGMCKYQGAAQVELWTGVKGSEDLMHKTLLEIIKERS
jgi:shikimate dehydrogenase